LLLVLLGVPVYLVRVRQQGSVAGAAEV